MWWSEIRTAWRLPGMALLALLVCRAEVGAQIGKVDCHDKEYPPWTPFWKGWWHQLSTFQAPSIPRHPCYRPYCNLKAPIENFGYTHQQWRVWPGTQPNYTPKNLKVGGESMPPAETEAHLPFPTPVPPALVGKEAPPKGTEAGEATMARSPAADSTPPRPSELPPPQEFKPVPVFTPPTLPGRQ